MALLLLLFVNDHAVARLFVWDSHSYVIIGYWTILGPSLDVQESSETAFT